MYKLETYMGKDKLPVLEKTTDLRRSGICIKPRKSL